jgi:hypothetical protein
MKESKREREAAAREELARRAQVRRERCPLDRDAFEALYQYVAKRSFTDGLVRGELDYTKSWLAAHSFDSAAMISFLGEQSVNSDWEVLVSADPCALFGPTPTRLARMPIDACDLLELLSWLERELDESPCAHDLQLTRHWLETNGRPVEVTEFALIAQGGGCDCEVVLNVDPENIYPPDILATALPG